jgi:hypothetical protein
VILRNIEQVVAELNRTLAYDGSSDHDIRTAQKGIDLISSLQSTDGPEKWIEYGGHLMLTLYHSPRFGIEGKRAIHQVFIDPHQPFAFGEIKYLLPIENRPWEYVSGFAKDIPDATAMIIDALARCEQRNEHLYESLE